MKTPFEELGWYCIVLNTNRRDGYVLGRNYELLLIFDAITPEFASKIKQWCLLHETVENYEVHTTPGTFRGVENTAFWMY